MSTTKAAIRQEIAKRLPGSFVGSASAGSSTTELLDQDDELAIFSGQGSNDLTGYWILRPSAAQSTDRLRRVAHHDQDLGSVKPSRAWTDAPSASETYEMYPPDMRPALIDTAIDEALTRLSYRVEETVTPVNKQNTYTLAYSWLTSRKQVFEVYREWTNNGPVVRTEWPFWKVYEDAGVFTLLLDPIPVTITGMSIIVEGRAKYTALASDSSTTNCPLDWATYAGLVKTYKALRRNSIGTDTSRYSAELKDAQNELFRLSRVYAPGGSKRVMMRTPFKIPPFGQTRRGEIYY